MVPVGLRDVQRIVRGAQEGQFTRIKSATNFESCSFSLIYDNNSLDLICKVRYSSSSSSSSSPPVLPSSPHFHFASGLSTP